MLCPVVFQSLHDVGFVFLGNNDKLISFRTPGNFTHVYVREFFFFLHRNHTPSRKKS